jgi:hypothetical protein
MEGVGEGWEGLYRLQVKIPLGRVLTQQAL